MPPETTGTGPRGGGSARAIEVGHQTATGVVTYLNASKGFGLIQRDDGGDVFFRFSQVSEGGERLVVGARVEFDVVPSDETTEELVAAALGRSEWAELRRLYAKAPEESRRLARSLLDHDAADSDWAEQVGPALTERDTALLLRTTPNALGGIGGLIGIPRRDGHTVYPIFQFDGRQQLAGVRTVVELLQPVVVNPLTIAGFLTTRRRELAGHAMVDALRAGQLDFVIEHARSFAQRASV